VEAAAVLLVLMEVLEVLVVIGLKHLIQLQQALVEAEVAELRVLET
jgi:hypothetical protein